MIVSYKWLQTYFEEKLPEVEKIEELLTLGAFEVENIEEVDDDCILDIDVLPNRAHDCLSHRGIAKEIAVLLKSKVKSPKSEIQIKSKKLEKELQLKVEEEELCRRYVGRKIEGVKVGATPAWLRERIEVIGQKSINNIVDATNYVMFDIGQPLHAFDADKVDGMITVRKAKKGEKITTLDDKEVELDETVLVIADEKAPLAIAGVKGGKKAEVDENTTNIILEAANFAPVNVRKTSRRLNILTDSSKRFENEITPEVAGLGMEEVSALVVEIAGNENTKVGEAVDKYSKVANPYKIGVSLDEVNKILGAKITNKEVENIFDRFGFEFSKIEPLNEIRSTIPNLIGASYVHIGTVRYGAPEKFSCSSLTNYLFIQGGLAIPSVSVDQLVFSDSIEKKELKFGDLVFSNTGIVIETGIYKESVEFLHGTQVPAGVDHVGMYLGDGKVLHASSQTKKVIIEEFDKSEAFKNIVGYGRIPGIDKERFIIIIPAERLDLRIKEDLIEEIGRVYGYYNIEPQALEKSADASVNKAFYYANKVRNILLRKGFSEVYTSAFTDKGEVEVENPMAEDKKFLRPQLASNLKENIEFNIRYADLLGVNKVKIFEIGKVFKNEGEQLRLCIAVGHVKSKKGESVEADIIETLKIVSNEIGLNIDGEINDGVVEINFDELTDKLPDPKSYEDTLKIYIGNVKYKTISPYPFIGRDIAVFVPEGVEEKEVKEIIAGEAGDLLAQGPKLFDKFEKKDKETGRIEKVSYAFSMVFQSQEKTLTDEEVNEIMSRVTDALNSKEGWEVR